MEEDNQYDDGYDTGRESGEEAERERIVALLRKIQDEHETTGDYEEQLCGWAIGRAIERIEFGET